MTSFWEQSSYGRRDAIVVGAGIVGLSCALAVQRRHPRWRIAVLDRSVLPDGASTRNAGFACFGSLTEILGDIEKLGAATALAIARQRVEGLRRLRRLIGDRNLAYRPCGAYELIFAPTAWALREIDRANDVLAPLFPTGVFSERRELLPRFGFNTAEVQSIVANPHEGAIDSGRMMYHLRRLAQSQGIEVFGGAEVTQLEETARDVCLYARAPRMQELRLRAPRVYLCCNAAIPSLAAGIDIRPARGQVLVTTALNDLPFDGTFHFDEGFYYFRRVGSQVLLGGARNLAIAEEQTAAQELNPLIQQHLEDVLRAVILPGRDFAIAQRWAGIMGFSADKTPIVRALSPRLAVGFGCNGMGLAIGTLIGERTAGLLPANEA